MSKDDEYKLLIGAFYGVKLLDEYELKEYLLNDIRKIINDFISVNKIDNYKELEEKYKIELSNRTKLQDALIVILLVKKKIRLKS